MFHYDIINIIIIILKKSVVLDLKVKVTQVSQAVQSLARARGMDVWYFNLQVLVISEIFHGLK